MKTKLVLAILLGPIAFYSRASAADGDVTQPPAPAITVEIQLDRTEFLLGESIAASYVMTNTSDKPARYEREGFYPTLRLTTRFRLSAFKLDEHGQPAEKPLPNWPMPIDMGGIHELVGPFLAPGESRSTC